MLTGFLAGGGRVARRAPRILILSPGKAKLRGADRLSSARIQRIAYLARYDIIIAYPSSVASTHLALLKRWLRREDGPAMLFLLLPEPLGKFNGAKWKNLPQRTGVPMVRTDNEWGAVENYEELEAFIEDPERVLAFFRGAPPHGANLVRLARLARTKVLSPGGYDFDVLQWWLVHLTRYYRAHESGQEPEMVPGLDNEKVWTDYAGKLAPGKGVFIEKGWCQEPLVPLLRIPFDGSASVGITPSSPFVETCLTPQTNGGSDCSCQESHIV